MAAQRQWTAVNAKEVQKALSSPEFIHKTHCACGLPIFTFHVPGECIEGRLRPCKRIDRADRAKTAELYWHGPDGKEIGVAFRLSGMLWKPIEKESLWGRWVKITYVGSLRGKFPNATKIYRVEVDKAEAFTEQFLGVDTDAKDSRNRKSRKSKQIRRPAAVAF